MSRTQGWILAPPKSTLTKPNLILIFNPYNSNSLCSLYYTLFINLLTSSSIIFILQTSIQFNFLSSTNYLLIFNNFYFNLLIATSILLCFLFFSASLLHVLVQQAGSLYQYLQLSSSTLSNYVLSILKLSN